MTLWFVLFLVQAWLISVRRTRLHRQLGVLGVGLAVLIVAVTGTVVIRAARRGFTAFPETVQWPGFLLLSLGTVLIFAVFFTAAVLLRRQSALHKRFMVLASLSILGPTISRLPLHCIESGSFWTSIAVGDACVLTCIAVDTVRSRRLNLAFLWGAPDSLLACPADLDWRHSRVGGNGDMAFTVIRIFLYERLSFSDDFRRTRQKENEIMNRSGKIITFGLVFFPLAATILPAAAQQCKALVGSFEAQVQPANTCPGPLCTEGNVWGGIQGTYRFTMDKIIPNGEPEVPTISFFTGHSIITLKSGDELFGTDTGTIDLPPGKGGFASLITFTGGTGSMVNATGQIRLRGEFDAVAGITSGDYIGTLCQAQ